MELHAYLASWEGKWFSQRTHFNFQDNQAENHKSELTIDLIDLDNPLWGTMIADHKITSDPESFAIKLSWDTSVDWGKPQHKGTILYAFIPPQHPNQGQLIRLANGSLLMGHYNLAIDESLTFVLGDQNTRIEERLWFASPNLRLRTSLIQLEQQMSYSAFYSEIRKLPPPAEQ